jgi:hypothetical protein
MLALRFLTFPNEEVTCTLYMSLSKAPPYYTNLG